MSSGYLCHCMSFILMWCSAPVHSVLPHQGNSLVHNLSRESTHHALAKQAF